MGPSGIQVSLRLGWPYDAALTEMHAARDQVMAGGTMHLFVGSHAEEVVTLGRHAPETQLVARALLHERGALIRRVDRGGGATAHGPGQLVVYPVIALERCGLNVVGLTRLLLEAAAAIARQVGLAAEIGEPAGLYIRGRSDNARAKLASVGFRVERGVVTHGLALNVDNDLSLFQLIAPCGVCDQPMASLSSEGGSSPASIRPSLSVLAERLAFDVAQRCVLTFRTSHVTGLTEGTGVEGETTS